MIGFREGASRYNIIRQTYDKVTGSSKETTIGFIGKSNNVLKLSEGVQLSEPETAFLSRFTGSLGDNEGPEGVAGPKSLIELSTEIREFFQSLPEGEELDYWSDRFFFFSEDIARVVRGRVDRRR